MYTFFRVSPHHDFLLFHLLFSSRSFSSLLFSPLFFFSSLFSCLLLLSLLLSPSPLFFFFFFFSLSSSLFSLCLLSPCVGWGVCVVVCVCVCGVVWCGVCRVVWHAENPCVDSKNGSVCRFKTSPPRVCRQHAHMLLSMWTWCRYTRGRLKSTHGKRFESTHGGHRQFCLPRKAHVGLSRASEVHRK